MSNLSEAINRYSDKVEEINMTIDRLRSKYIADHEIKLAELDMLKAVMLAQAKIALDLEKRIIGE